ncbi:hypothetical protein Tco_0413943 [Tanacetum coccineum]
MYIMTSRPWTRVSVQAPFEGVTVLTFKLYFPALYALAWFRKGDLYKLLLVQVMAALVPVAPEVGAAAVASPAGVLKLDTHSLSEDDSVSDTKMPERHVSPKPHDAMLSRWRSRVASRSSSPATSTPEIHTAPIPPVPSAVDIPISRLYRTHPGGPYRALTARNLVRPLPSHRLALKYTSHHLDRFTSRSSSSYHSSSDHSSSGHSTSDHSSSRHSISGLHDIARPIIVRVPSRVDLLLPHKKFRDSISSEDSVEEDINTNVLADIEVNATAIEVAADMDVEAGINTGIGMEVDVGVDGEDEVEGEVEEVVQDIFGHVMEIPLQRVEDIETGHKELEARSLIASGERAGFLDRVASLERSNARPRGTLRMESARVDRFRRNMSFMAGELRQIRRFLYYDRMRFRRLETFAARRWVFVHDVVYGF